MKFLLKCLVMDAICLAYLIYYYFRVYQFKPTGLPDIHQPSNE